MPKGVNAVHASILDDAPLYLYWIEGEQITLIDTGIVDTPSKYLLPALEQSGRSPSDIGLAIITHGHHDHFGGNGELCKMNPAIKFAASGEDAEWIEDKQKHFNELYLSFPGEWEPDQAYKQAVLAMCGDNVPLAFTLEDGQVIRTSGAPELTAYSVPAHSKGHLMIYIKDLNTAFVGDAIQSEGTMLKSGIGVFPLYDSVETYLESLRKILDLKADWICTGHFGILDEEGLQREYGKSVRFLNGHNEKILSVLKARGMLSLKELVENLHECYYSSYELAFQLHATTHTHCRHLRNLGEVERVVWNKELYWRIKKEQ